MRCVCREADRDYCGVVGKGWRVTSVAAMLAIAQVERAEPTVLVDLCGAMPALLGGNDLDEIDAAPGITDWCATPDPEAAALARIERPVRTDLTIVPRGAGSLSGDAASLLQALGVSQRRVIVDCGVMGKRQDFRRQVVAGAPVSLLVVRECFLNLRAAQVSSFTPTAVVIVKEPGRHLGRADVEAVTGAPVVAQIAVDASIARSLDAGLATARLPRSLLRALGRVSFDVA